MSLVTLGAYAIGLQYLVCILHHYNNYSCSYYITLAWSLVDGEFAASLNLILIIHSLRLADDNRLALPSDSLLA